MPVMEHYLAICLTGGILMRRCLCMLSYDTNKMNYITGIY